MFPFRAVPYGSRVIIYGAGQVGQEYLCQLRETDYAIVVCLVDVQADRYQGMEAKVCYPSDINGFVYDYVVIAIKDDAYASNAVKMVLQLGIPKERIISQVCCWPELDIIRDRAVWIDSKFLAINLTDILPIAVSINGGIGDCLIRKRQLEEMLSWDKDIIVDVYTTPKRKSLLQWLLADTPQVHTVVGNLSQLTHVKGKYAAAFAFGYSLDLLNWKPNEFNSHPDLLVKMKQIEKTVRGYGVLDSSMLMSVEFRRAEKDGLNCYTAYNRYEAFHISDWHIKVPFSTEGENRLQVLKLYEKDYITVSCGCDMPVGYSKLQAKAWPVTYWEKFIKLLHEQLPDIAVVQVDSAGFARLSGCDTYVVGENLEVAVQVLRKSMLHVDNEGGLVHLATQLGTKCVVLFGPTPIEYFGYKENINLQEGDCKNCCWLAGNPRSCYKKMKEPQCMYSIKPDRVLAEVSSYLQTV